MRTGQAIGFVLAGVLVLLAGRGEAGSDAPLPIDGALSVSNAAPAPGQSLMVYLTATAVTDLPTLKLQLKMPPGVSVTESSPTTASFESVAAGRTVVLAVRVTASSTDEQLILGTATLAEDADLTLRRSFAVHLHKKAVAATDAKRLRDGDGAPMLVYPGGPK